MGHYHRFLVLLVYGARWNRQSGDDGAEQGGGGGNHGDGAKAGDEGAAVPASSPAGACSPARSDICASIMARLAPSSAKESSAARKWPE